eukprot:2519276-Pyramimonas_sp.AAC.1
MSIAAKRAILLMQNIVQEDLDIAKATMGIEKELIRLKGKMIYQMYKEDATTDIDSIGGGESDIRNIRVLEKELEPTQTCKAPVDLHPVQ